MPFIKENIVDEIIDATASFADIVSKEASRAAEMAVSYLRFERQRPWFERSHRGTFDPEAIGKVAKRGYKTVYLGTGSKDPAALCQGTARATDCRSRSPTSEVLLAAKVWDGCRSD